MIARVVAPFAGLVAQIAHAVLLWQLRELEERELHLMREIHHAQREVMRLRGKEAMLRYKLRVL